MACVDVRKFTLTGKGRNSNSRCQILLHKRSLLSRKSDNMTPPADEAPNPPAEDAPYPPADEDAPPEGSTEPESAEARPLEEATLTKEEEDKLLKVGSLTLTVRVDVHLTHQLSETTHMLLHSFATSLMSYCRTFTERSGRLTGTMRSIAYWEPSSSTPLSNWGCPLMQQEKTSAGTIGGSLCWCTQTSARTPERGMPLTSLVRPSKRCWKTTASRSFSTLSTWHEVSTRPCEACLLLTSSQQCDGVASMRFTDQVESVLSDAPVSVSSAAGSANVFPYIRHTRSSFLPAATETHASELAEELRKERKKATKNDAVVRLASAIHEVSSRSRSLALGISGHYKLLQCSIFHCHSFLALGLQPALSHLCIKVHSLSRHKVSEQVCVLQNGREGVESEYEKTPEFHDKWKLKSRDMIAQAEWRRRNLNKRVRPPFFEAA